MNISELERALADAELHLAVERDENAALRKQLEEKNISMAVLVGASARETRDLEENLAKLKAELFEERTAHEETLNLAGTFKEELQHLRVENRRLRDAMWLAAEEWMYFHPNRDPGPQPGECMVWAESETRLLVNCGDTFAYSCADHEEAQLTDTTELRRIAETEGWPGIVRWCQKHGQRGEPIDPVRKSVAHYDDLRKEYESLKEALDEALGAVKVSDARIKALETYQGLYDGLEAIDPKEHGFTEAIVHGNAEEGYRFYFRDFEVARRIQQLEALVSELQPRFKDID